MTTTEFHRLRRPSHRIVCVLVLAIAGACSGPDDAGPLAPTAELIVINADVHTSDPSLGRAQAFAIADGRFIAVGSNGDIEAYRGDDTRLLDAGQRVVLPGLIDGHTHLVSGSRLAIGVDLSMIEDKSEWLRIIADKVEMLPDGAWLLGGAWDHTLSDGVLPDKDMLDSVAPNHPVLLRDIDGHSVWANSLAIELAGITADTPVPPGAEIVVDEETGEPTGIFKEAGLLFADAPGLRAATDPEAGIRAAIALANSLGITSVHDMSGHHDEFLAVLESGDLSLRIWQGYRVGREGAADPAAYLGAAAAERDRVRLRVEASGLTEAYGPLFEVGYVKLVVDGVLSTHTALMRAPYSDLPEADPDPLVGKQQLSRMVAAAHDNGFPVAVHAIGDAAVSWVIDAFAASRARPDGLPDRVEHIEVVAPDDVERFRELGIVASMQPHHATCCVGNYVIDRIGRDRLPNAYAWRAMLDNEVGLVLGSDWATSPFNPLVQIADTMHRSTRIDGVVRAWDEGNTLSFEEALHGYTRASANVTAWAEQIGSISAGKWADFVILDRALPTPVDPAVAEARVTATYLAGRRVYP